MAEERKMEQLGSVFQLVSGSFPTRPRAFWMSTLSDTSIEPLLTIYEFNKVHLISKTSKLSTCGQLPGTESKSTSPIHCIEQNWNVFNYLKRTSVLSSRLFSASLFMSEGVIGDTSPSTPEVTAQESLRVWTNQKAFSSLQTLPPWPITVVDG